MIECDVVNDCLTQNNEYMLQTLTPGIKKRVLAFINLWENNRLSTPPVQFHELRRTQEKQTYASFTDRIVVQFRRKHLWYEPVAEACRLWKTRQARTCELLMNKELNTHVVYVFPLVAGCTGTEYLQNMGRLKTRDFIGRIGKELTILMEIDTVRYGGFKRGLVADFPTWGGFVSRKLIDTVESLAKMGLIAPVLAKYVHQISVICEML